MDCFESLSKDAKAIVASNLTVAAYLVLLKEQIKLGDGKETSGIGQEEIVKDYYCQVFDFLENN